jgi:hypothetical protein
MGAAQVNRINQFDVSVSKTSPYLYFDITDSADLITQTKDIRFRLNSAFNQWKSNYLTTAYSFINNMAFTDARFDFSNNRAAFYMNTYLTYVGTGTYSTYNTDNITLGN